MKSVFGWIGAILAAAVGGLLVIIFQAPLAREFSGDRLRAEVIAAEWVPLPSSPADLERQLGFVDGMRAEHGEQINLITLRITNGGAKRVENIRLKFGRVLGPRFATVSQAGKSKSWRDVRELVLDPIGPGNSAVVRLWTTMDPDYMVVGRYSDFRSYSSEGPIIMNNKTYEEDYLNDPFIEFVGKYLEPYTTFIFVMFSLFAFGAMLYFWLYGSFLIGDVNFYRRERIRYEREPKAFFPKHPDDATQKAIVADIQKRTRKG